MSHDISCDVDFRLGYVLGLKGILRCTVAVDAACITTSQELCDLPSDIITPVNGHLIIGAVPGCPLNQIANTVVVAAIGSVNR